MNALIEPMPSRPLTKRQREVLALLTQGLSNKEIARMIGIAEATTKIHMAALIRNLGARNRTEAAFMAAQKESGQGIFLPQNPEGIWSEVKPPPVINSSVLPLREPFDSRVR